MTENRKVGTTKNNSANGRKHHFEIKKNVNKLYSLMGSREKNVRILIIIFLEK